MDQVTPESVGMSSVRLQRVSSWLQQQVDSQRLAGCSALIGRRGHVAFAEAVGMAELETGLPFSMDTIVRIYSMTKAVTTVAAMMLYEEGAFQLDDPISTYLPEFAHTPVWRGGDAALEDVEAQQSPITVRHLMTHTSGLTYGFMQTNVVDAAYREADIGDATSVANLEEMIKRLAALPLICQPGTAWNYSVSTDVLGRLVEVWSGLSLSDFFEEHLLGPLAMTDTAFQVAPGNQERFAALYVPASGGDMSGVASTASPEEVARRGGLRLQESASRSTYLRPAQVYSGGGGLTGSIGDYARFCQMLLNGGELDGQRILGRKTVEYMRLNHLPENRDMAAMGQPVWSETSYDGIGFGLGWAVVIDPVKAHIVTSPGEYHWGGAASTFFWMDPTEELFAVFFTQLMPSSAYPIRRELRTRVYQSLID
jgi:CubicO group peptidase (beta-lactamase class C family)